MYLPIMRGKQNELIALRELAEILSPEGFKPIIEPVKLDLNSLIKTVTILNKNFIFPIIIINPNLGEFSKVPFANLIDALNAEKIRYIPCIKVFENNNNYYADLIKKIATEKAVYISEGINIDNIKLLSGIEYAIVDKNSPELAINQLKNVVLMTDAFQKKTRNADYPDYSYFSDSHLTYQANDKVIGFGDHTIVGSDYAKGGGPAYVVTIHLSYINKKHFDAMYIRHFSSEDNQSPTNPGGKFNEALAKLIHYKKSSPDTFVATEGLAEFERLHERQHFPGLGVVKKNSMKHHIETICNQIKNR